MLLTQVRHIALSEYLRDPVRITFLSRKGSIDEVLFTKFVDEELETKPKTAGYDGGYFTYQVNSESTSIYYSPWFTELEYRWLKDLVLSPYVKINGDPVRIRPLKTKFDNFTGLFRMELEVSPEFEENKITR